MAHHPVLDFVLAWNGAGGLGAFVGLAVVVHYAREEREQLRVAATHDAPTGLPNRVLFVDRVGHTLALSPRRGPGPSVLAVDLDGFKQVNDLYGHHVGNVVLVGTAQRLSGCIRESDTCARSGGDEFAILPPYDGTDGSERVVALSSAPLWRHSRSMGRALGFTQASAARPRRPMATTAPPFFLSQTSECTETSRRDPAAFQARHRSRSTCSSTAEADFRRHHVSTAFQCCGERHVSINYRV